MLRYLRRARHPGELVKAVGRGTGSLMLSVQWQQVLVPYKCTSPSAGLGLGHPEVAAAGISAGRRVRRRPNCVG